MTRMRLCQPSTAANVRALGVESKLMMAPLGGTPERRRGAGQARHPYDYASSCATNMPEENVRTKSLRGSGLPAQGSRWSGSAVADRGQSAVFRNPRRVTYITRKRSLALRTNAL